MLVYSDHGDRQLITKTVERLAQTEGQEKISGGQWIFAIVLPEIYSFDAGIGHRKEIKRFIVREPGLDFFLPSRSSDTTRTILSGRIR